MNIAEILKNVPKGTKLYSPIFGEVTFMCTSGLYIEVLDSMNIIREFWHDGKFYKNGECMLFPSRENRDWNTFKKFDINTLKPFDRVLARDHDIDVWSCEFYSHYRTDLNHYNHVCSSGSYHQCIPYNDDTKHLVGTTEDCSEYYKTW